MKRALGRVPGVVAHLPVRWRLALGVGFTALVLIAAILFTVAVSSGSGVGG